MIPISRPDIDARAEEAVLRVLRSGRLAQGPEVAEFERAFAEICGVPHVVACANGTAALHIALLAHGVGPGDEVIVPGFTFAASANAVLACGATPVFCDVREDDFCIDAADAARRVTPATRAIMPVHLYGQVADMNAVRALAREHGLAIIEDACQAHGAEFEGTRAGGFSTGAFSFYATKNAMSGEGGAVTALDDDTARTLRLLRNHGMEQRYVHETFGLNLRMTELQGALASASVAKLEDGNALRRDHAERYGKELSDVDGLVLPAELPGRTHVWHQYTIRVRARDAVLERLRADGVGAEVYYPTPLNEQRSMAAYETGALPVSELLAREVISLPVFPSLTEDEHAHVVRAVRAAVEATR